MAGRIGGLSVTNNPDRDITGFSRTNKVSAVVRTLSRAAGFGISIAPKRMGSVRRSRANILSANRAIRDINAIANGKVRQRIINRAVGKAGGLAVNAVLPATNNIALRFIRARVGSYMNKRFHTKLKKGGLLEIFGPKATNNIKKQLFSVKGEGNIFQMMHRSLLVALKATAPRTEFTMNINNKIVQFSPNNLADSVFMRDPVINPRKGVLGEWKVSVGGSNPTTNVADKAPYVWIAQYGGILFNPQTGQNDQIYAPTFFATKAVEVVAKLYRPVIKKVAQIIDPVGMGKLSGKEMVKTSFNDRAKTMHKIWLSKSGEKQKAEKEIRTNNKRRKKKISTRYEGQDGMDLPSMLGDSFEESIEAGAQATMEYLYGGRQALRETKFATAEYKRKRKGGSRKTRTVKSSKRTRKSMQDIGVGATGTEIRIIAEMRELKAKDRTKTRYLVGQNNRYKDSVLEPATVKIRREQVFDLGSIKLDESTRALLKDAREKGIIAFKFNGNKIENAVIKDVDKFIKHFDIDTRTGSILRSDTNAGVRGSADNVGKIEKNIRKNLTPSQLKEIEQQAVEEVMKTPYKVGTVTKLSTDKTGRVFAEVSYNNASKLSELKTEIQDLENDLRKLEKARGVLKGSKTTTVNSSIGDYSGATAGLITRLDKKGDYIDFNGEKVLAIEDILERADGSKIKYLRPYVDPSGRTYTEDNVKALLAGQTKKIRDRSTEGGEIDAKIKEIRKRLFGSGQGRSKDDPTTRSLYGQLNNALDKQHVFEQETLKTALNKQRRKITQQFVEQETAKQIGGSYFQPVMVSGTSRKIKSVSRQHETVASGVRMPTKGSKGMTNLSFKIDRSQAALADTRGLGKYVVEVHSSSVTPLGKKPGKSAIKKINPTNIEFKGKNIIELTYTDPSLPTAQMTLRAGIKGGKLNKKGISLQATGGGKVQNVTANRGQNVVFIEDSDTGQLRVSRKGENIAAEKKRVYGIADGQHNKGRLNTNEIRYLRATPAEILGDGLPDNNLDFVTDAAFFGAAIRDAEKGITSRTNTKATHGYNIHEEESTRGFIIRFEDY